MRNSKAIDFMTTCDVHYSTTILTAHTGDVQKSIQCVQGDPGVGGRDEFSLRFLFDFPFFWQHNSGTLAFHSFGFHDSLGPDSYGVTTSANTCGYKKLWNELFVTLGRNLCCIFEM